MTTINGHLDVAEHWIIEGWAYNKETSTPVELLVFDNGRLLGRTTADAYRADLEVAALGNTGRIAFRMTVLLCPVETHEISVVVADTGAQLPGSPKIVDVSHALNAPMMAFIATLFDEEAAEASLDDRVAFVEGLLTKLLVRRERGRRRRRYLEKPFVKTGSRGNGSALSDRAWTFGDTGTVIALETSTTPLVSIIIPVFRIADRLARCLRSIARSGSRLQYEIIVVLNEASPRDQADLAAFTSGLIIIASELNLGLAGACNRGKAVSSGEFLVILHDDTEVETQWLDELVRCAFGHPRAGAVMSKILFPDGRLQHIGRLLSREGGTYPPWSGVSPDADTIIDARHIDSGSSSSLLIRRTAWNAIGGLEERFYPAYFVDVDACMALQASFYSILCEPRSVVRHFQSASSSREQKDFYLWRNRSLFLEKWSAALQNRIAYMPQEHDKFVERAQDRCETFYAMHAPSNAGGERPFDIEAQDQRLRAINLSFTRDLNAYLVAVTTVGGNEGNV